MDPMKIKLAEALENANDYWPWRNFSPALQEQHKNAEYRLSKTLDDYLAYKRDKHNKTLEPKLRQK